MHSYSRLRRPRLLSGFLLPAALLACGAAACKPESYALDPVHTRVAFQVSHAGFSNPVGSFSGATGTLEFDDKNWAGARLSARIPIATLELGDDDWQKKILDRTFFDAEKFPEARFVSTRVEPTGEKTANVTGDLTLHGVTRPVTLAVTLNALKRHPLTLKKTAGFSATATVSRKEFGMAAWQSVVGDEVRLIIEAEAVRNRDDADAPDENSGRADPSNDTTPEQSPDVPPSDPAAEPADADPQ